MPRVSIFFGIVIYFYYDDHPPPHFHAMYEGVDAQFDFSGNLLKGNLPPKAVNLIQEWTSENKKSSPGKLGACSEEPSFKLDSTIALMRYIS